MQQAGLVSFFRTIFFVLLFYYGFVFLMRYVLPFVLARFQQNMFRQQKRHSKPQKEGETSVDPSTVRKKNNNNSQIGEYIDFEEIDDE